MGHNTVPAAIISILIRELDTQQMLSQQVLSTLLCALRLSRVRSTLGLLDRGHWNTENWLPNQAWSNTCQVFRESPGSPPGQCCCRRNPGSLLSPQSIIHV